MEHHRKLLEGIVQNRRRHDRIARNLPAREALAELLEEDAAFENMGGSANIMPFLRYTSGVRDADRL